MTYQEQKCLQVVAFHEGTQWVAQVLEHDLACQASTLSDLLHAISRITDAHVAACKAEKIKPWELEPAPAAYHKMWEDAVHFRVWEPRMPKPLIRIRIL